MLKWAGEGLADFAVLAGRFALEEPALAWHGEAMHRPNGPQASLA
jgi:hypothetical protein